VRNMFAGAHRPQLAAMRDVSKDRTRSLLLLIGGSVGAVLLFIGVFSTPPRPSLQEARSQAGPNLGRPAVASARAPEQQGSVTPLLTADVRSTDLTRDQLSPSDISGTSRRSIDDPEALVATRAVTVRGAPASRSPVSSRRRVDAPVTSPSDADDPLARYRIDDGVGAPTYQYGVPLPADSGSRGSGTFSYGGSGAPSQSQNGQRSAIASPRSSIVFVRDGKASVSSTPTMQPKAALRAWMLLRPAPWKHQSSLRSSTTTSETAL
jgi:hypothetical protein